MDIQNSAVDFQNKSYEDVQSTAQKAEDRKAQDQQDYDAALAQYNIFREAKNNAYSKYQQAQLSGNASEISEAKSNYATACCSYTDADNAADILNSKLMDSIFYAGKINNSACIARSIFG